MLVSMLRPPWIAVAEQPFPRWQVTTFIQAGLLAAGTRVEHEDFHGVSDRVKKDKSFSPHREHRTRSTADHSI